MPNHVVNKLTIKGQSVESKLLIMLIKNDILNNEGLVDFSILRPMPKEMEGFEPCVDTVRLIKKIHEHHPLLKNYCVELRNPKLDKLIEVYSEMDVDNKEIYRAFDILRDNDESYWYSWRLKNWGSKWNAYHQSPELNKTGKFTFQTAWEIPDAWLIALSKKWNDVVFELRYADENTGYNCGIIQLKGGQIIFEDCQEGHETTKKWKDFARRMWK